MNYKMKSTGEKIFTVVNSVLLITLSVMVLYPLWYIFISAVSNPVVFDAAMVDKSFILLPQGFTLEYIMEHVNNSDIWHAYGNTVIYTVFGAVISILLTILASYVLTREFIGVKLLNIMVVLTIFLKPGMIATYLNIENLGMMGTRMGILLPFAFSGFNAILLKTGFENIHKEILEAAKIDGANEFQVLACVVLPNSIPLLTTVSLFYMIERWNGYFWAEVVLQDGKLYPLQVLVKKMLQSSGDSQQLFEGVVSAYALIVIAIVPMILLFPFIQKFFKKGIMDGSVK